jgi:hypothetical protein
MLKNSSNLGNSMTHQKTVPKKPLKKLILPKVESYENSPLEKQISTKSFKNFRKDL